MGLITFVGHSAMVFLCAISAFAQTSPDAKLAGLTPEELQKALGITSWKVSVPEGFAQGGVTLEWYRNGVATQTVNLNAAGPSFSVALRETAGGMECLIFDKSGMLRSPIEIPEYWGKKANRTESVQTTPQQKGNSIVLAEFVATESKPVPRRGQRVPTAAELGRFLIRVRFDK